MFVITENIMKHPVYQVPRAPRLQEDRL